MMSGDGGLDEIVTTFLLNTCQLRPHPTNYAVFGAMVCGIVATQKNRSAIVPLTTGSLAEFYIEPMLPYIGDIDVMCYRNIELAIPRGYPPPTQLPPEFHSHIQVVEIIDSDLPGFVYLVLRYLLTENSDDGNYVAVEQGGCWSCLANLRRCNEENIHGPAITSTSPGHVFSVDSVPCVRCLMWLPQADDWPTRHRNYGWPDSATIDRVVSNGCDVVGVAHRQCRQHELMAMFQWRLSFSRAEIVLLNSWIPVQQIVYHMLRYFVKTERLTDCADNSGACTLSNYHIKTLMLWACEMIPRNLWTDKVNLVSMCVQLLNILAECLTNGRCQHYFINDCNLLDNSFNVRNVRDQLMSIDETWLSAWFVDNYIRKSSQFTPLHISRLFDDVSTSDKLSLQRTVSALVAWKQNNLRLDLRDVFDAAEVYITLVGDQIKLTARSCACMMTELAKIDLRLLVYFTAVAFLHVASTSVRDGLTDELVDALATVCGQFINTRRYPYHCTSVLSLNIATKLMKTVANKSLSTMSLMEIELSKAYLYRALRCKDSDSDSIYCLANVYLAVLYYTTGQYQTAIDHCTLVTRSQDHSQCSSYVVQGEILPQTDDYMNSVLGLAVFYQHVRTSALNQKHKMYKLVLFTTELLAYYLHVKCLSDIQCRQFMQISSADEFKRYEICISDTQQLFIGDVLLFLSLSQLFKFQQKTVCTKLQPAVKYANEYNTPDLVELLQKSAVEHLTTFRQLEALDFGSVVTIVTTDFEALYAYKCGNYQRCLQLSTQNVHTLLYHVYDSKTHDVLTFPQFIQLFDDDIVSLIALTVIVDPGCRYHPNGARISQLTLSLYLMTQCQLKLHHSVTSLLRTLEFINVAQSKFEFEARMNPLVQKLTKRKALAYITEEVW